MLLFFLSNLLLLVLFSKFEENSFSFSRRDDSLVFSKKYEILFVSENEFEREYVFEIWKKYLKIHVHNEKLKNLNDQMRKYLKKILFFLSFSHSPPTETRYHIETPESRTFGSGRARENCQGWPRNEDVSE